jgi:uncharacterized protein YgiM (DUF1202 family)
MRDPQERWSASRGRSRRGYRTLPKQQRTRGYPSSSLLALGLILGALTAMAWQIWLFLQPMLAPPPRPEFSQVTPLPVPVRPTAAMPTPAPPPPPDPSQQRRVIEPLGLIFRAGPGQDAPRIGGIVLGETVTLIRSEGGWDFVRRELNGQEGWVRSGNLGSLDDPIPTPLPTPRPTPTPAATSPELSLSPPPRIPVGVGSTGRVIEPLGLILRQEPGGSPIGGIPVGEQVTVLGVSPDQQWQQVRRADGQEGWIRAGNLGQ